MLLQAIHSHTHRRTHTYTWKGKCWIARHLRCTAGTKERRGKQVSKRTERKVKYEAVEENLLPNLLVYFTPPPSLSLPPSFPGVGVWGGWEKTYLWAVHNGHGGVVWCALEERRAQDSGEKKMTRHKKISFIMVHSCCWFFFFSLLWQRRRRCDRFDGFLRGRYARRRLEKRRRRQECSSMIECTCVIYYLKREKEWKLLEKSWLFCTHTHTRHSFSLAMVRPFMQIVVMYVVQSYLFA